MHGVQLAFEQAGLNQFVQLRVDLGSEQAAQLQADILGAQEIGSCLQTFTHEFDDDVFATANHEESDIRAGANALLERAQETFRRRMGQTTQQPALSRLGRFGNAALPLAHTGLADAELPRENILLEVLKIAQRLDFACPIHTRNTYFYYGYFQPGCADMSRQNPVLFY